MQNRILPLLFFILLLCFEGSLFCQSKKAAKKGEEQKFLQRLEWNADPNALRYEVEIQSAETGTSQKYKTEESYLELSLEPGSYRFRVFAFDFLDRESPSATWLEFSVFKAATPEFVGAVPELDVREDGILSVSLAVKNVTAKSKVELVEKGGDGRNTGFLVLQSAAEDSSEIYSAMRIEFNSVKPGNYFIVVTNPSGLSSQTEDFEVKKHKTKTELREEEREAKKRIMMEKGYLKLSDFSIMVGGGVMFPLYDKTILEWTDWPVTPEARFKVLWLPWQPEGFRLGMDVDFYMSFFFTKNDYMDASLMLMAPRLQFCVQREIFMKGLYISLSAGGGLCMMKKEVDYTKLTGPRESPEKKLYGDLCATASLSLHWLPSKGLALEGGAEFMHVFSSSMPTGSVSPYIMMGVHF